MSYILWIHVFAYLLRFASSVPVLSFVSGYIVFIFIFEGVANVF